MLKLLGSPQKLCDGVSRREILRAGSLASLGLSLPALLAGRSVAASMSSAAGPGFGTAKRCLMLYMWGGPAHQDLFDMKPDAPANIRGEFRPAATNVPGIHLCEHMPALAQHMDKLALIRSVTHTDNNHSTSAHWMLTGYKHRLSAENFGASSSDHPHIGSVISRLTPAGSGLPTFVSLPDRIATTAGAVVPGQFGGMIGKRYDPFMIDQHPDEKDFEVPALALPKGIDPKRVRVRSGLLAAMNSARTDLQGHENVGAMQAFYERASDMISSPAARRAFDLSAETDRQRDQYGRQTFGQSLLMARRLLEAGVKLVTVYWHRDKPGVDTTWDTHGKNFSQLKDRLIPQIDQPIATLLEDLQQRGMLDDTLIVWNSEFGRTPKVNKKAGRDHWGRCNTIWMAGGGVPGGQVYGSSDKHAAAPKDDPVSPGDVTATIYHLLGINPHQTINDRENRPFELAQGEPLERILLRQTAKPNDIILPLVAKPKPAATPNATPSPEILADKPLAYWPLGETSGTQSRDAAGKTPGTFLGQLAKGDRRMRATVKNWGDEYTAEFCFQNTRAFDAAPVTGYIFSRAGADAGNDRDRGEHVGIGGTHRGQGNTQGKLFIFNGDDSKAGLLAGRTKLEVGHWYHVVLTRAGDRVRVYLNGETAKPEIAGKLTKMFTTGNLFIATRHDAMFPLQGTVQHVALYNRVLSVERIAVHYGATVGKAAK
jgi:hypothetical protein